MRPASPRLGARLTGIALLAVVPALFAIAYLGSHERERARARTLSENLRLARLAAAAEAEQFDDARGLLATLAEYRPLLGNDTRECGRILRGVLLSHPGYVNLSVANADGTLFCSGTPLNPAVIANATGKRWFDGAMRMHAVSIGEVRTSAITRKPSIIIGYPMIDSTGQVRRVVTASIAIDQLRHAMSSTGIHAGAGFTLFDTSGTIILRSPEGDRWIGKRVSDVGALHRLQAGAAEDLTDTVGADGVSRLYATVPVHGSFDIGMYLGFAMDRRVAYAEAQQTLRNEIWLLVFVTLAGVIAALVGGATFVLRPIRALRGVVDRLARGDLAARADLVPNLGGVGDLVDGVNAMAAALDARKQERDEAEVQLRASEDRYRLLFEKNPNSMWVYDSATYKFLEVNEAAVVRYGYSRDEFLSMNLRDVRPPEEVPRLEAFLAQTKGVFRSATVWQHRRKCGEVIDVEITTHEIMFEGRSARLVAAQDVSDRTRAERALRDAEERMRFALDASRVGVWEADLRTRHVTLSEACEAMHGMAPDAFLGNIEAFRACVHPDDRQDVSDAIGAAIRNHRDAQHEYRIIRPDGVVRRINSAGRFFYAADGTPLRGAGISMDVTEQRSIEAQLRQSQKMEAVGRLAGGIAHDFNNLLTVIAGNVEIATGALAADSPVRADLDEAHAAATRAAQLTRQLLAFSRKQTLQSQPVNVCEMIASITPMLRRLIGEDIAISSTVCAEVPVVVGDRAQLEQVLMNLSVNARDAMPRGGRLSFDTTIVDLDRDEIAARRIDVEAGRYVVLTVSDTGVGMDGDALAHAFEPFFTTKGAGKGTGLGLSSVYGTVKQSGGHVTAASTVGAGTVITMYLPLRALCTPEEATAAPLYADTGSGTILLVEDDDSVRALAHRLLKNAGFSVLVAESGPAAIQIAKEYVGHITLVLSDVVMPGMSGLEMVEVLETARPGIGVLMMSGYPDGEFGRRGIETHRYEMIEKPFTRDTLIGRVQAAIADHRSGRKRSAKTPVG
ncbi:MAG: PAS domain S-box protein [Gemmatimonadaceae bacterium]